MTQSPQASQDSPALAPIEMWGFEMTGARALSRYSRTLEAPKAGHVVVRVSGCGVCHTDIGYLLGEVPPKKALPLTLGHEASGVVVSVAAGEERWLGRRVIVPAVWPCGECDFCRGGQNTSCARSLMPGNDVDGAFASHIVAPARWLCDVDEVIGAGGAPQPEEAPIGEAGVALWQLSVMADAVTTPLQAIQRAHLRAGDLAVVVGIGGVGSFGVQIARAFGAVVVAIDVNPARLELARSLGAHVALDATSGVKAIRGALREAASKNGARPDAFRVFEMSGSKAGQELAFSLLNRGAHLAVVGFTPEVAQVRLSNLMALDATAAGNWGSDPAIYPEALRLIASGKVKVDSLVRREPLAECERVLDDVVHHKFAERVVLVP